MSFGWSGSDVFQLAQLAWKTVQNSRKACGEYDVLTREALRLHAVLQRLEQEVAKPESPINRPGEPSKEQLERVGMECEVVLGQLNKIVTAYASLSEDQRSARKIWQRVRFGNGQMADLGDLRSKLTLYTSEMMLYLNLISMSTVGRIEQRMNRDGGVLRDIKVAVEKKTAHTALCGNWEREGSVLTAYTNDDTGFWRELRRDLIKDGLPSAAIHKHKHLIKRYVKELGARGVLDDESFTEHGQQQHDSYANVGTTEEIQELPSGRNADLNVSQEHDNNADVRLSEDPAEQSLSDNPLNKIAAEDLETRSPDSYPRATISRSMKEPSHNTTDDASGQSGAEIKAPLDRNDPNTQKLACTEILFRKILPTESVPSKPDRTLSVTSRTILRRHAIKASSAAQKDALSYESSCCRYLSRSIIELQSVTNLIVTATGTCYIPDARSLCEEFGQRIDVILGCVHDQSVPPASGDSSSYPTDVEFILYFVRSAQDIIRDLSGSPPLSLLEFRESFWLEEFLGTPDNCAEISRSFSMRIRDFIMSFDRQCNFAIGNLYLASIDSLPSHNDAPDDFHDPPGHIYPDSADGVMPLNLSSPSSASAGGGESKYNVPAATESDTADEDDPPPQSPSSKEITAGASGAGNPDSSSSSRNRIHRSATSKPSLRPKHLQMRRPDPTPVDRKLPGNSIPLKSSETKNTHATPSATYRSSSELKHPPTRRSETMPVYSMRPGNPVPLKSSDQKNMKVPSGISDSSSESDSEMIEENQPPPMRRSETMPIDRMPDRARPVNRTPRRVRFENERRGPTTSKTKFYSESNSFDRLGPLLLFGAVSYGLLANRHEPSKESVRHNKAKRP